VVSCADLPEEVADWSLTSLQSRLIKIGARVVRHARSITFQHAEVSVSGNLFNRIRAAIQRLRAPRFQHDGSNGKTTEENRLNKFAWASDDQPGSRENPAIETESSVQFTRQAPNNRTTRENGLIGAHNNHNMQVMAFHLGNVSTNCKRRQSTWRMSAQTHRCSTVQFKRQLASQRAACPRNLI